MNTTRVLLVDDHALVRDSLAERLQREPDLDVIATAADGEAAVRSADDLSPDVVVMDIDMPGIASFEAAKRIRGAHPECRLIFLSAHSTDRYIQQALDVGALGYLTKAEPIESIVKAIHDVTSDRACFSEEVQRRIVIDDGRMRLEDAERSRVSTLTTRELEVMRYLAQGMAKKTVAAVMHVSPKTIDKHSENLMRKLDIHDRVDLARFAIREGIAEP